MSILPPTLDDINDAIAGEAIKPGFVRVDADGAINFVDNDNDFALALVGIDAPAASTIRIVGQGGLTSGKLQASHINDAIIGHTGTRTIISSDGQMQSNDGGDFIWYRSGIASARLGPSISSFRNAIGIGASPSVPAVRIVNDGTAGLMTVTENDGITRGTVEAGQLSLTKSAISDSDDFVTVNNGVRDIFSLKSRDGAVLNVGASRYLDISRDGVQSLRLGNFSGVPHVVTADGLRLLVGARQSTAADYCVGIYNDVEPDASTPLVKFGYGLNGPATESAKLMADGTFHVTQVASAGLKLTGLPTSDPGVQGQVWQDGTDLQISAG